MTRLITKEKFIKIFENNYYRKKLDQIILNFFGLELGKNQDLLEISKNDIILEIIVFINTEYLLKIIVKDTKHLFQESKRFYINFSFREVEKYHELLMPCYWEIYCLYSLKNIKIKPKIVLIAALFSCKYKKEVQHILRLLHIFNKNEINNILREL